MIGVPLSKYRTKSRMRKSIISVKEETKNLKDNKYIKVEIITEFKTASNNCTFFCYCCEESTPNYFLVKFRHSTSYGQPTPPAFGPISTQTIWACSEGCKTMLLFQLGLV